MRAVWLDPRRILPLHELRRSAHFHELVERMRRFGWQGRPLVVEALADARSRYKLMPSGHFMGWTGTHRLAAARAAGIKVPVIFVAGGRPSRRPLAARTTTDASRFQVLRRRRDPAALLLLAEMRINEAADANGRL